MRRRHEENPFIFGEVVTEAAFVDRVDELQQVVRDVTDGQKLFLLSPRRFGKSSLVAVAFERLKAQGFKTVIIPVSNYATYRQFLEKFADKVVRAAGPWSRVKDWVGRFIRQVKPDAELDLNTGEVKLSLGKGADIDRRRWRLKFSPCPAKSREREASVWPSVWTNSSRSGALMGARSRMCCAMPCKCNEMSVMFSLVLSHL